MQANAKYSKNSNCMALFSRKPNVSELSLSVQGVTLHSQELVKLLGVIIDKGLRFNEHVSYIC